MSFSLLYYFRLIIFNALIQYYQNWYKSMRRIVFLLLITTLIQLTLNQTTNFDYKDHGNSWTGDCAKNLSQQSPVILSNKNITSTKQSYLFADFRSIQSTATIYNTTVYLKAKNSDEDFFGQIYTQLNDGQPMPFKAFQIRIRTRSQHRINDANGYYDLQIQISCKQLFQSSRNTKLMMGLLFQAKDTYDDDPFLAQIIKNAKDFNQSFPISVNLTHLISKQKIFNFWFYKGSATIPPCSNGKINWIVPQKIFKMSKNQLQFFQKLYPDGNWRDVQQDKENQISYATALPASTEF